jgi:D-galactarolactone cycloisomerase
MLIKSIDIIRLAAPLSQPFQWATGSIFQRTAILIRVVTDSGHVGWGETLQADAGRFVRDAFSPMLIGKDPLNRLALRRSMLQVVQASGVSHGIGIGAVGAIDIALWDIAGKIFGQPLHRLLGGALRDSISLYASGLYYNNHTSPIIIAQEAAAYIQQGFSSIKMKIGRQSLADDSKRIAIVRDTIGSRAHLMVDANQAYNYDMAMEMGLYLEDMGVYWFEEPLNINDIEGYRRLAQSLKMHLAAGENFFGREEFTPFISEHLIHVAQPNIGNVGGVTEFLSVAALADFWHIPFALHGWGSSVLFAAALHVASCIPYYAGGVETYPHLEYPLLEFDCTPNPMREPLSLETMPIRNGTIRVPEGPGLGINLDEKFLERYRIDL